MICRNCGTQNSNEGRFCRKCGSLLQAQKAKKSKKFFLIPIIILAVLLVSAGVFAAFKFIKIKPNNQLSNIKSGDYSLLTQDFTDEVVKTQEDAVKISKEALTVLGIEKDQENLEILSVNEVKDFIYYKVQEKVDGYEVLGRTAVVITDKDGEVLGFSSNISDYDLSFEPLPECSVNEMVENLSLYCKLNLENGQELYMQDLPDPKVLTFGQEPQLVYSTPVYGENCDYSTAIVYIDPYTCEILGISETVNDVTCYNSDKSISVDAWLSDGSYWIANEERQIYIQSYLKENSEDSKIIPVPLPSENTIFGDTEQEKKQNQDSGVQLLQNTSLIYDYFDNNYNERNYERYIFAYDDAKDNGENAAGGTMQVSNDDSNYGYITMGHKMGTHKRDVIAHEFTHIITGYHVGWYNNFSKWSPNWFESNYGEPSALNEAYSDVFGIFIESYLNNQEPDWIMQDRNIADPEENGDHSKIPEKFSEKNFSYKYSTIISHCAYEMYYGLNGEYTSFSGEEILDLFYYTMFTLPSNCSFQTFYQNLIFTANQFEYSDEKIKCINAAFAKAGIDNDAVIYDDHTVLSVLDVTRNQVFSYKVEVTGTEKGMFSSKDYSKSFEPEDDGNLLLDLPDGDYTIKVMIDDYSYCQDITVKHNSGYKALVVKTYYFKEEDTQITVDLRKEYMEVIKNGDFQNAEYEFYDLDGDTVDEMIIMYGEDKLNKEVKIFSIRNDETVELMYDSLSLPSNNEEYYGHASIATKDGEKYLILASTTTRSEVRSDFYKVYSYDGEVLQCVEYCCFTADYDENKNTIKNFLGNNNQEEATFDSFKNNFSNYEEKEFLFSSTQSFLTVYEGITEKVVPNFNVDLIGTWIYDIDFTQEMTGNAPQMIFGSSFKMLDPKINFNEYDVDFTLGISTGGVGRYEIVGDTVKYEIIPYVPGVEDSVGKFDIYKSSDGKIYLIAMNGDIPVYFSKEEKRGNELLQIYNGTHKLITEHTGDVHDYDSVLENVDDRDIGSGGIVSQRLYNDNIYLVFVNEFDGTPYANLAEGKEYLRSIACFYGDFCGIEVGIDSIDKVIDALGQPDSHGVYQGGDGYDYTYYYQNDICRVYIYTDKEGGVVESFNFIYEHNTINNQNPKEPDINISPEKLYSTEIQIAMARSTNKNGEARFADINSDGKVELIMCYVAVLQLNGRNVPHLVTSVYTVENNKIKELMYEEPVYYEAGAPSGHVALAVKNGEKYFIITSENGESNGDHRDISGFFKSFKVDDLSFILQDEIYYNYVTDGETINYEESRSYINEKDYDFSSFEKIRDEYSEVFSIKQYDDENKDLSEIYDISRSTN